MDLLICLSLIRIFAKVVAWKFEFDGTQDVVSMTQRLILGQNPERAIFSNDAISLQNASMENKYFERHLLVPERAFYRCAQGKFHVTLQRVHQFL